MPHHKSSSTRTSVSSRSLPSRQSRHGRLLSEVYRISIPEVSRLVTTLDKKTGEYKTERKVITPASVRVMTQEEMAVARTKPRADGPTTKGGKKNDGGPGANVKKVKAA